MTAASPPFGRAVLLEQNPGYPSLQAWKDAIPKELKNAHAQRQREWTHSRVALERAFSQEGLTLVPNNCTWVGKQGIAQFPSWRFSISHTQQWSMAWIAPTGAAQGIGVDIEIISRQISEAVFARIFLPGDIGLAPLSLWSAKEAAFKCLASEMQESLWPGQIQITEKGFLLAENNIAGFWHQSTSDSLVQSFAWMA